MAGPGEGSPRSTQQSLQEGQIFDTLALLDQAAHDYASQHGFPVKKTLDQADALELHCADAESKECSWQLKGQVLDASSPVATVTVLTPLSTHKCTTTSTPQEPSAEAATGSVSPAAVAPAEATVNNSTATTSTPSASATGTRATPVRPRPSAAASIASLTPSVIGVDYKVGSLRWLGQTIRRLRAETPKMTVKGIQQWIADSHQLDVPLQRVFHANRKMRMFYPGDYAADTPVAQESPADVEPSSHHVTQGDELEASPDPMAPTLVQIGSHNSTPPPGQPASASLSPELLPRAPSQMSTPFAALPPTMPVTAPEPIMTTLPVAQPALEPTTAPSVVTLPASTLSSESTLDPALRAEAPISLPAAASIVPPVIMPVAATTPAPVVNATPSPLVRPAPSFSAPMPLPLSNPAAPPAVAPMSGMQSETMPQPVSVSQQVSTPQPVAMPQPMSAPQPVSTPQPVAMPQPMSVPQTMPAPMPMLLPMAAPAPVLPATTITALDTSAASKTAPSLGGTYAWVLNAVRQVLHDDPDIKATVVRTRVQSQCEAEVPMHRIYQAVRAVRLELANNTANAEYEDETAATYALLPEYCRQLVNSNPDSIAQVCVKDADDDFEFSRIFVSMHCLIQSFAYCRRVICLRSKQLQGARGGHLLSATTVDANDQMLPLAWAVSQECTHDSWKWFLELLKESLASEEPLPGPLTFILDTDPVLATLVKMVYPDAYAAYCFDSIKAQVGLPSPKAVTLFNKAALATNEPEFARAWRELHNISPQITRKLEALGVDRWVDLKLPNNERLGTYTLAAAMEMDVWIKEKHDLPAYRLLQALQFKTVETLNVQRIAAGQRKEAGRRCSEFATIKAIESSRKRAGWTVLANMSETLFTCTHAGSQICRVFWTEAKCDCGQWQQTGIPCEHAAAVLGSAAYRASRHPAADLLTLVNPRFLATTWHATFQFPYEIVPSEMLWPLQNADEHMVRAPRMAAGMTTKSRSTQKKKEVYVEADDGELTIDGMTEGEAFSALAERSVHADMLGDLDAASSPAKPRAATHKRQRSTAQLADAGARGATKRARLSKAESPAESGAAADPPMTEESMQRPVSAKRPATGPLPRSKSVNVDMPRSAPAPSTDVTAPVKRGPGRPRKIRTADSAPVPVAAPEHAPAIQESPITTHAKKKRGPPKGWKQARALAAEEEAQRQALSRAAEEALKRGSSARHAISPRLVSPVHATRYQRVESATTQQTPAQEAPKARRPASAAAATRPATAAAATGRANASADTPAKRPRGRPPGPKTLALRAAKAKEAADREAAGLPPLPSSPVARGRAKKPTTRKRHAGPGRPRKNRPATSGNGEGSSGHGYTERAHYSAHGASPFAFEVQDSNVREDGSPQPFGGSSAEEMDVSGLDREAIAAQFVDEDSENDGEGVGDDAASWRGSEPQGSVSDEDMSQDEEDAEEGTTHGRNTARGAPKSAPAASSKAADLAIRSAASDAIIPAADAEDDTEGGKQGDGHVKRGYGMFRRYEVITEPRPNPWKRVIVPFEPEPGKVRATRRHRKSSEPSASVDRTAAGEDDEEMGEASEGEHDEAAQRTLTA